MKDLVNEIYLKAQGLRQEYNRQRGGVKAHNKEVLRVKAERLIESLERLKEGLK